MQPTNTSFAGPALAENQLENARSTAKSAKNEKELRAAAEEFEAVFIGQMLAPIFDTAKTEEGMFGGGHAEDMYQSLFVDEVGKSVAKNGGVGIADQVYAELLKLQES